MPKRRQPLQEPSPEQLPPEQLPPEQLVEEIERASDMVRAEARAQLGITGTDEKAPPLRQVLREEGVSLYPLLALSVLGVVNIFLGYGAAVLTPDISRSLGLSIGAIAGIGVLSALGNAIAPLPVARLTQRKPRRALLAIISGAVWALLTLYAGFVAGIGGLAVVLIFDGLTSGSVEAVHRPLVMDAYPPRVRVRALSAYSALGAAGLALVLSPLLVAVLTGPFNLTWRGVFVVFGVLSIIGTLFAVGLRDPGFGRFDTDRLRRAVHEMHGEAAPVHHADVELRFFEIMRRLMIIPTVRRLSFGSFVLGIFTLPYGVFLAFFLDLKWGLDATERGLFFAGMSAAGVVALLAFGSKGEAIFRKDPARILALAGVFLSAAVLAITLGALIPWFPGVVVAFAIGSSLAVLLFPTLNVALLSIVEAQWRAHMAALLGIYSAVGGLFGAFFLSGVENRFGVAGAMISLIIPGVFGSLIIGSARLFVNDDIDRMIAQVVEEEEIDRIRRAGGHLPMLACRNIDFAYGKLQVLFDVDFTVDDGEIVALLGVNGAGKSTLLKVVSGIGLPTLGTVRFAGQDITFLDAERRLRLGITQVPGGRAVFAPLSVVDNLRVYGYALRRDKRAVDEAIDRSFAAFPRLHDRREQLASTLSGGEQQMLGLCKALILRPQLLLIDELSLGLAPVVVGQLLEMVKEINATGTAVVLVEQSVNIALSIAEHAYFMERGQIMFDGPAGELLGRTDLLRAVFLEGATKGITP